VRRPTLPLDVDRLLVAVIAPLALATVVGLVVLWPDGDRPRGPGVVGEPVELVDATVEAVRPTACGPGTRATGCAVAEIRIEDGIDAGATATLDLVPGPGQPDLAPGDAIVVGRASDPQLGTSYYFSDFQRRAPLVVLGVLFAVVVVAVGRLRGLAALVGVAVSVALVVTFVLPALLEGSSPLAVSIVGSAAIMFVLLYLAHGVTAMTTAALVGTLASLALTGLLAGIFVEAAHLVSGGSEEATLLQFNVGQVNLQGLLLGSIIIGSLGVLNDVTVTQASAVWQLREADPAMGAGAVYRSAMRIGRDHIASAVDTLVLAYAGASLPLLLLFSLAENPVGEVLSGELVASELVRTLVGSIGLALSVPVTTGIAAFVVTRRPPAPARARGADR